MDSAATVRGNVELYLVQRCLAVPRILVPHTRARHVHAWRESTSSDWICIVSNAPRHFSLDLVFEKFVRPCCPKCSLPCYPYLILFGSNSSFIWIKTNESEIRNID